MDDEEVGKPRIKFVRDSARQLLKQAKITTYPIKVKDVLKIVPNLHIDSAELEDEISGMQATVGENIYIRYNESHPKIRKRFTVSHELGHAFLGHTLGCRQGSNLKSKNPFEIEANQFAAELLMPFSMLKEAVKKSKTVSSLAYDFWVSKEAMSWRIKDTSLYIKLTSWN